jgi:integrase
MLLQACPTKVGRMVRLALITGARIGELLALRWDDVSDTELLFLDTKNGRSRRLPRSPAIDAVLKRCSQSRSGWVFTNARTHQAYTVNGVAHVFKRALTRAGILSSDVSLHTLRHTALSRMIAAGIDTFTVMAISGHSSTRMLERYTHPTDARKTDALESFIDDGQNLGRTENQASKRSGGRQEARTPDLRVANAALSQLS